MGYHIKDGAFTRVQDIVSTTFGSKVEIVCMDSDDMDDERFYASFVGSYHKNLIDAYKEYYQNNDSRKLQSMFDMNDIMYIEIEGRKDAFESIDDITIQRVDGCTVINKGYTLFLERKGMGDPYLDNKAHEIISKLPEPELGHDLIKKEGDFRVWSRSLEIDWEGNFIMYTDYKSTDAIIKAIKSVKK